VHVAAYLKAATTPERLKARELLSNKDQKVFTQKKFLRDPRIDPYAGALDDHVRSLDPKGWVLRDYRKKMEPRLPYIRAVTNRETRRELAKRAWFAVSATREHAEWFDRLAEDDDAPATETS
jgi:hypothetical protein